MNVVFKGLFVICYYYFVSEFFKVVEEGRCKEDIFLVIINGVRKNLF